MPRSFPRAEWQCPHRARAPPKHTDIHAHSQRCYINRAAGEGPRLAEQQRRSDNRHIRRPHTVVCFSPAGDRWTQPRDLAQGEEPQGTFWSGACVACAWHVRGGVADSPGCTQKQRRGQVCCKEIDICRYPREARSSQLANEGGGLIGHTARRNAACACGSSAAP